MRQPGPRNPEPNANGAQTGLHSLTGRESEIIALLARGLSNKEISGNLSISIETVRTHLAHIYQKLRVRGRTGAAAHFLVYGVNREN